MSKKNILISNPNYFDTLVYLPYIYTLLKNFAETDPAIRENYNWLEPIFLNNTAENLLKDQGSSIDILGLSCYLWNWPLQLEIAQRVKRANPNCLVIMGGPHPDWKDKDFFKKYSFIDIVVKHEGEKPFYDILVELLKTKSDFSNIPGLLLPNENRDLVITPEGKRIEVFQDQSAWLNADMISLAKKYHPYVKLAAVWETNRGCPYKCSFCDWGSATYTKIRHFSLQRLDDDLKFFAENKILKIFIADSNFGMFPRDYDLANKIVYHKKNSGYPTLVYWATSKNNADSVMNIATTFYNSGLDDSIVIAMQSTNEKTIQDMGRTTRSLKTYKELSERVDTAGIPKIGQLIMGAPEESATEFKASLHQMLELNFHKSFFLTNYTILPNAPITDPALMQKHQIKTITRPANRTWGHRSTLWKWKSGAETIIVGHKTLSVDDWVHISHYKTHLMCLHHLGLTRLISRFLKNQYEISYADFYQFIFDQSVLNTGHVGHVYAEIKQHFADYTENTEAIYALNGIDEDWFIDQESALFCRLITKQEEYFSFLRTTCLNFARQRNLPTTVVQEIIDYQINLIITPDYDPKLGRHFSSNYNFLRYFKDLNNKDSREVQLSSEKTNFTINEKGRDLKDHFQFYNWHDDGQPNLKKYQHSVIIGAYRRYILSPLFEEVQEHSAS